MSEISVNDCALPGNEHPRSIVSAKITVTNDEWDKIRAQPTHRLYKQANAWPLASSCGFLTSRAEDEWNEEWTSSGDLTYIGAMPKLIKEEINKYCKEALAKAVGAAEREVVKGMCNNVKSSWKDVMKFSRAKPRAIQRAIAGQLNKYKKDLQKKEKMWLDNEEDKATEDPLETALTRDGTSTPQPDEVKSGERTEQLIDCIG